MIPALFRDLLDDAAVFPPGLMPLSDAVPAARDLASPYADIARPLVLPANALAEPGDAEVDLAVTAPGGPAGLPDLLARAGNRSVALEVAVPGAMPPAEFFAALEPVDVPVFVEVPCDERRAEVIATCARTGHRAKLRTGRVRGDLYPDEAEPAAGIHATVAAGVPFKATAGLHHTVRTTDPVNGFEQHGYLNLLAATGAALNGAGVPEVAEVLALRDGPPVASTLAEPARAAFRSFGTCSIIEPLTEPAALGLVPAAATEGVTP